MRVGTDLKWHPSPFGKRINEIIMPWLGTRYMSGQQCKGVAVDCVRFIQAFSDEFRGKKTELFKLPQDTSLHSRDTAIAAMRTIVRLHEPVVTVEGVDVYPGDAIVVGPVKGGPGHLLLTGGNCNCFYHATNPMVCQTGLNGIQGKIFRIFRLKEFVQ